MSGTTRHDWYASNFVHHCRNLRNHIDLCRLAMDKPGVVVAGLVASRLGVWSIQKAQLSLPSN